MAGSLALVSSPADVHLYGLDCGNGALLPLADLPHCGAVVQRTQPDRATRLLTRLMGELARRQDVLGSRRLRRPRRAARRRRPPRTACPTSCS